MVLVVAYAFVLVVGRLVVPVLDLVVLCVLGPSNVVPLLDVLLVVE